MFSHAILSTFREGCELVALCDVNPLRMNYQNEVFASRFGAAAIPCYPPQDFEKMIWETRPDVVIVTTIDRLHHEFIVRAMEAGCDVISEKPLTTDLAKCLAIHNAIDRTGRDLRVTFNYRYSPSRSTVKRLLMENTIGEVKSVHFEWLLDTLHGADYFRRWHRDKRNSGGLMVHKSTHHFDLVNWWLCASPETVFGFGTLGFYGKANGEARGAYRPYVRATDNPAAQGDPFALDLRDGGDLQRLYLDAESSDAYIRDQNVFGDGISIEDTMNVVVRYDTGTQLSYSLTAYAPWEGYRIAFNGTLGRIELDEVERPYVNAGQKEGEGLSESIRIRVCPHWSEPYEVTPPRAVGGHGGGDQPLLETLFAGDAVPDPLRRSAGFADGVRSIMTGIAANQSFQTGLPVRVADILPFRLAH